MDMPRLTYHEKCLPFIVEALGYQFTPDKKKVINKDGKRIPVKRIMGFRKDKICTSLFDFID